MKTFLVSQVCYAKELKEGFVEYTEQVVKLMVPLLKFYFHDDILSSTARQLRYIITLMIDYCSWEPQTCSGLFLNGLTCQSGGSGVHAPAAGVRSGPRTRVPHPDVALHV